MQRKKFNTLLLTLVIGTLILAFMPSSQALSTAYKYENFGSPDADGINPYSNTGEIEYVYAEHGWTANVDANSRFYINSSGAGVDGSSNFTFNSSSNYDYFEFRFLYLNDWTITQNHAAISFVVAGSTGTICTIQVYGANTSVGGSTNRVKVLDYNNVEVANETIAKDKWYTVRINPDYDTWDLNAAVTIYDVSGGVYTVSSTEIGLGGNTDISKFYMVDAGTETSCITVDNFILTTTTLSRGDTTTNYLSEYIFPILFSVALLVGVIGLAFAGADIKSLITIVILSIVGVVALMILTSI